MNKKQADFYWRRLLIEKSLLDFLATKKEKSVLAARAAIFRGLAAGRGQRPLSRELSVSLQMINAVKKAINEGGYHSYAERSKKERKKKEFSPTRPSRPPRPEGRSVRTKFGVKYFRYL